LIVDTHSGAIVSVDPVSGTVDWGLLYESPAPVAGYNYNYTAPPSTVSAPVMVGGLMFSKGMRSPRLLGVAADVPRIVWNRPVGNTAALVAADPRRLYLSGEELTAYDLQSQQLLWATRMPVSADWAQPLVTKNRLYQFTSRGVCEVDKADGRMLRIFRGKDHEALGGMLYRAPQVLVTVSNAGITAYPLAGFQPREPEEIKPKPPLETISTE
jgi:outer membrane protein assembly factor BamB